MKKKLWYMLGIMLLCLGFFAGGNTAQAAGVTAKKVAYVDAVKKSIELRFESFSQGGYTYKLTDLDRKTVVVTGTMEEGTTALSIPLEEKYRENARYKLEVTGANKQVLGKYYYTGTAIKGLKAVRQSDNSLKCSWTVTNAKKYNGYQLTTHIGASPSYVLGANLRSGGTTSKILPASKLKNNFYRIYLISYKTIGGANYAGQGLLINTDYVKVPERVVGFSAVPDTGRAKLSWSAAVGASYYNVYMAEKSTGTYKAVLKKVKGTSCSVTGLKAGKKYYFKVRAVAQGTRTTASGKYSAAKSASIPVVAGQVKNLKCGLDSEYNMALVWDKTANATGYRIYYKKSTDLAYKRLVTTKKTQYALGDLAEENVSYTFKVRAYTKVGSTTSWGTAPSKEITFNPKQYMKDNFEKMLADSVRSIGYIGTTRCVYTSKKYPKSVKLAFVNHKGYSSQTKYLIWISHYTQQVSIFEGKKGDWKMIRTFVCATGTAKNHSPRGTFKLSYKEKGWFYTNTKELYVSHYCGRNSFHTRPLWNDGSVQDPTIGKPASHGCIRCYNQDAKYIYDKIPCGTTVVSY